MEPVMIKIGDHTHTFTNLGENACKQLITMASILDVLPHPRIEFELTKVACYEEEGDAALERSSKSKTSKVMDRDREERNGGR